MRKAGFYLAGIIHARYQADLEKAIKTAAAESPTAKIAESLLSELRKRVEAGFSQAVSIFEKELKEFVESNGKDEDAALKNSDFAKRVFETAKSAPRDVELNLTECHRGGGPLGDPFEYRREIRSRAQSPPVVRPQEAWKGGR